MKQVAHCTGAELTWASTPAIAKQLLLIRRGQKTVFREPRSGLGFGGLPLRHRQETLRCTGLLTKADTASSEAFP